MDKTENVLIKWATWPKTPLEQLTVRETSCACVCVWECPCARCGLLWPHQTDQMRELVYFTEIFFLCFKLNQHIEQRNQVVRLPPHQLYECRLLRRVSLWHQKKALACCLPLLMSQHVLHGGIIHARSFRGQRPRESTGARSITGWLLFLQTDFTIRRTYSPTEKKEQRQPLAANCA